MAELKRLEAFAGARPEASTTSAGRSQGSRENSKNNIIVEVEKI